jgi:hypothetical protein
MAASQTACASGCAEEGLPHSGRSSSRRRERASPAPGLLRRKNRGRSWRYPPPARREVSFRARAARGSRAREPHRANHGRGPAPLSRLAHSEVLAARSRSRSVANPLCQWHPRSEVRTRRFCRSRGEEAPAFETPSCDVGIFPGVVRAGHLKLFQKQRVAGQSHPFRHGTILALYSRVAPKK